MPNNYGGFEQFAEYLSIGLEKRGFDISVYNSHDHPYKFDKWHSVSIIHRFDPEYKIGTAGQFIYDLNCILDTRNKNFDLILQLGYTSSSVWNFLFPKSSVILTNMDGLEWKRSKYSKPVQAFLKYAERLAVKKSHYLISDSIGIQKYLMKKYQADSVYIPYGAEVFSGPDQSIIKRFDLLPYRYDMLIARLEPENSIEMILDGFLRSKTERSFVVIANYKTNYGKYLVEKYHGNGNVIFLGAIYDVSVLNNLRYFSNLYFHGHTVGGTNPSLLEAMASSALVAANKNDFNAAILGGDAYYFNTVDDVTQLCDSVTKNEIERMKMESNVSKIRSLYSWEEIVNSYENLFSLAMRSKKKQ